jgi:hypothetical protein
VRFVCYFAFVTWNIIIKLCFSFLTYICLKEMIWQISYDLVKDILVQGDHMRDTLQQLQDAVYLTKALSLSLSCIDMLRYTCLWSCQCHLGFSYNIPKVPLFCVDVFVFQLRNQFE